MAGIVSAPPVVWTPIGTGAEVKFQCAGIVNTAYDEVSYLSAGWTGQLATWKDSKIKLVSKTDTAPLHTITVTLSEVDSKIGGLAITCYVQKKDTSKKLDWVTTTFQVISMFIVFQFLALSLFCSYLHIDYLIWRSFQSELSCGNCSFMCSEMVDSNKFYLSNECNETERFRNDIYRRFHDIFLLRQRASSHANQMVGRVLGTAVKLLTPNLLETVP